MTEGQLEDLLDEYSRLTRTDAEPSWLSGLPESALVLTPLLALTRELATLLAPARPRTEYRVILRRSLLADARQRQAQRILALPTVVGQQPPDIQVFGERVAGWLGQGAAAQAERRWVLGAAAVGSAVSLAGVLAYVLTHRGRRMAA